MSKINDLQVRYESGGEKQATLLTDPIVTGVQPHEFMPTVLRFKAMDMMSRMESSYHDSWDDLKAELALFIKTWKEHDLNDEVSKGIIQNMENQVTESMVKQKYMEKWGEH
jgi:hypothetical protein